jgi:hypothetical protein
VRIIYTLKIVFYDIEAFFFQFFLI